MPSSIVLTDTPSVDTIIFDMDGVVTSERSYWTAAELVTIELLFSPQYLALDSPRFATLLATGGSPQSPLLGSFVTPRLILLLKNCGINTNWDLAAYSFIITLIHLLSLKRDTLPFVSLTLDAAGISQAAAALADVPAPESIAPAVEAFESFCEAAGCTPHDLASFLSAMNLWREQATGLPTPVIGRNDSFWDFAVRLFQEWLHGTTSDTITKCGLIQHETPIMDTGRLHDFFRTLKSAGFTLGIATGRPHEEIVPQLASWDLLKYFALDRVRTFRDIGLGEKWLSTTGATGTLAKPHPYIYLSAAFPEISSPAALLAIKCPLPPVEAARFLIVGDTMSDLMAARAIGAPCAMVLSGVTSDETISRMNSLAPEYIIDDVTGLLKHLGNMPAYP